VLACVRVFCFGVYQAMWKNLQFWEFYFVRVLALQPRFRGPGKEVSARRHPNHLDDQEETVFQLVRENVLPFNVKHTVPVTPQL
jgi:hypothetical protein